MHSAAVVTDRRASWLVVGTAALALVIIFLGTRPAGHDPAGGWAFETCTGARNAGVVPVRGHPESGYHPLLDDDGNGIGCEEGEGPKE